jgi:hypothetical protein
MNKKTLWDTYRSSQEKITMSGELKEKIMEGSQDWAGRTHVADTCQQAAAQGSVLSQDAMKCVASDLPTTRVRGIQQSASSRKSARLALPIAACLAVLIVVSGLFALPAVVDDQNKVLSGIAPGFAVKAYAADTDSILETGDDSLIIFSRIAQYNYWVDKRDYLSTEGYYTGSLFRVQGENIARIQASLSKGVLYRHSTEQITRGADAERWQELISWKPSARGIGKHYGGYDSVELQPISDGAPKGSPDQKGNVVMLKKLGSTIDLPFDKDASTQSFGFWTNEDYRDGDEASAVDAILNTFEGALLTITVTDTSGKAITQVIELHTGYVRSTIEMNEEGVEKVEITPELMDVAESELLASGEYLCTIYGKVIKTTQETFPGPLDDANALEGVVGEPMSLFGAGDFNLMRLLASGENLQAPRVHPASTVLPIDFGDILGDGPAPFSLSNVSASRSKTLPEGITLDDLDHGLGSWEYFNTVVSQLDGYTLDASGAPTNGFSWVVMSADLTNDFDQEKEIFGSRFGALAVVDSENRVFEIMCRDFELTRSGGWDPQDRGSYADIVFAPHETKTIKWLFVAPDSALDDPSIFFTAGQGNRVEGFELDL